jgi:hypothetical protein
MVLITKYLTMLMPPLQGKLKQDKFFLFAAADPVYFDIHARPLINSVKANTPDVGIHLHIYDARPDQIEFASQAGTSCSFESTASINWAEITQGWLDRKQFDNERQRQMYKKGQTLGPVELERLIKQTYYACARFVRLAELLPKGQRCLALDVDGLVRNSFEQQLGAADFYLYEKPKDGTHLAGAMLFNGLVGSNDFLQHYARELKASIENNDLYWFLDQLILDQLVPHYRKGLLPMSYIDWAMKPDSAIWSAKGKRKELDIFKHEQAKYQ